MNHSNIVPGSAVRNLYVPENFDPARFGPDADYACYVLSLINQRIAFERLEPDEFVPLMSKLLMRVLHWRKYKSILRALIDAGVLECDNSYQVGKKSKGYRLTTEFRSVPFVRHAVQNPTLAQKLQKLRDDMEAGIVLPVHRHLYQNLQKIDFCYQGDVSALGLYARQAQDWLDRQFHFSTCQYGRVHTNLTNLKSHLRQHLRFQGQELCNIDIANSQPLFLGLLCANFFLNSSRLSTSSSFCTQAEHFPELIDFCINQKGGGETGPLCVTTPQDLGRYLKLCQEGRVYEELAQGGAREDVKKKFFTWLFGENRFMIRSPLHEVFTKQFPTLAQAIEEIKRKDYRHIAALLQRTESNFVVHRVCERLRRELPDVLVSTIHDSWVTTTKDQATVQRVVRQEFGRFRIRPTLRIERLVQESRSLAG